MRPDDDVRAKRAFAIARAAYRPLSDVELDELAARSVAIARTRRPTRVPPAHMPQDVSPLADVLAELALGDEGPVAQARNLERIYAMPRTEALEVVAHVRNGGRERRDRRAPSEPCCLGASGRLRGLPGCGWRGS